MTAVLGGSCHDHRVRAISERQLRGHVGRDSCAGRAQHKPETPIAAAKVEDRWVIKFLTASEEECRRTFMKADLQFKERSVLVVDKQDRLWE